MIKSTEIIIRKTDAYLKELKHFVGQEIHIKLEQDDNPVVYMLKKIGKDYLIVDYGESQRIVPIDKILFVQIGSYPK